MPWRFLLVGALGFAIDLGITLLLAWLGLAASLCRVPAIASAMLFTWLANRSFTYRVSSAPRVGEAVRYAAVAATMAGFNWLVYVVLIRAGLGIAPAVFVATGAQAVVSYHAYKRFAFRGAQ